jgi:hypothetical protein
MNRRGHRGKVDGNQKAIVGIFERANFSVQSLAAVGDGCPDLLVGACGWTYVIEIKNGKKPLTPDQRKWHDEWRGFPVLTVISEEQAVKFVTLAMRWAAGRKEEPRPDALPDGWIAASQAGTPGRR